MGRRRGSSLETYESTQSQVARELAVGGAAFVAVAGLGAYWLARAALSPVERLRRQVAAISASGDRSSIEVPSTRDEIAALAGTMNELLGRLQRALARQRAFAADASHELRTPLAVLRGRTRARGPAGPQHARTWPPPCATPRRKPSGWPGSPTTSCCWPGATRIGSACGWSGRISGRCSRAAPSRPLPAWPRPASPAASTCQRRDVRRGRPGPDPPGGRQPGRQRAAVRARRLGHRARRPGGRRRSRHRGPRRRAGFPAPASCRTRSSGSGARTAGVPVMTEALA